MMEFPTRWRVRPITRGYGSPDFVAYMSSISESGPPKGRVVLNEADMATIKNGLTQEMKKRTMTIEFEP